MMDDFTMGPFDRQIVGQHGAFLIRRNRVHADDCVNAIRRRLQPLWSRMDCGFRVELGR